MMFIYLLSFICVVGMASGQILFKMSAVSFEKSGNIFSIEALMTLTGAMILYAFVSVLWVWVLRYVELGKVYPLMSFAFILVPIASHYVFNELFSAQYFIGVLIIMAGIIVTTSA